MFGRRIVKTVVVITASGLLLIMVVVGSVYVWREQRSERLYRCNIRGGYLDGDRGLCSFFRACPDFAANRGRIVVRNGQSWCDVAESELPSPGWSKSDISLQESDENRPQHDMHQDAGTD
jgi:hypothetical protein